MLRSSSAAFAEPAPQALRKRNNASGLHTGWMRAPWANVSRILARSICGSSAVSVDRTPSGGRPCACGMRVRGHGLAGGRGGGRVRGLCLFLFLSPSLSLFWSPCVSSSLIRSRFPSPPRSPSRYPSPLRLGLRLRLNACLCPCLRQCLRFFVAEPVSISALLGLCVAMCL